MPAPVVPVQFDHGGICTFNEFDYSCMLGVCRPKRFKMYGLDCLSQTSKLLARSTQSLVSRSNIRCPWSRERSASTCERCTTTLQLDPLLLLQRTGPDESGGQRRHCPLLPAIQPVHGSPASSRQRRALLLQRVAPQQAVHHHLHRRERLLVDRRTSNQAQPLLIW